MGYPVCAGEKLVISERQDAAIGALNPQQCTDHARLLSNR